MGYWDAFYSFQNMKLLTITLWKVKHLYEDKGGDKHEMGDLSDGFYRAFICRWW